MLNPLKLHWQYPGTGMPRTAVGVGKRPYICSSAPCSASRRFSYALNIFHIMRGSGCRDFLYALHDGRARCPRTLRHVAGLYEHITIVIYVTNLSDLVPSKKPTKKLRWRAVRITKKRSSGRQRSKARETPMLWRMRTAVSEQSRNAKRKTTGDLLLTML